MGGICLITSVGVRSCINVSPTVNVNLAVYTDAGYTTPAICNYDSLFNQPGLTVEGCFISVAANQRLYLSVSQEAGATAFETYTLSVMGN
jgi:hypothetical protein